MTTSRYRWLYHRLQSMSIPEVSFRVKQYVQKKTDKQKLGWKPGEKTVSVPETIFHFDPAHAPEYTYTTEWEVFNRYIDFSKPIDWHLDISTGKRFPLLYAKEIDIRTGRFGSAKYVWEINRLQFLPSLTIQYRRTNDNRYLAQFTAITQSWIQNNPYLVGVNWYSNIEVNIRLINWFICWNILDGTELAKSNESFDQFVREIWLPSIYQHCVHSYRNPSLYSSSNNHLVSEYAGLFVASTFWQFPESGKWAAYARKGLEKEIQIQHSAKGVNREEAAEYIQFITDLFLIPYAVAKQDGHPFSSAFTDRLKSIITYINDFLDCKGNFPQYGDEDDGRILCLFDRNPYNNFRSLLTTGAILFQSSLFKQRSHGFDLKNYILFGNKGKELYDSLPMTDDLLESTFYPEEGHFIFRKQQSSQSEICLHFDAAPLGFLSIAAHGHSDALSFIMHVDGQPLFVDTGTYTYHTEPNWRNYFVSTRAHNTLCIDGQNQAFQAGALLWLNHYKTEVHLAQIDNNKEVVVASHSGYERIGCSHQRSIEFNKINDTFTIIDRISNKQGNTHSLEVFFHLHPSIIVVQLEANRLQLRHDHLERQVELSIDPSLSVEIAYGQVEPAILGWYSERFYRKQATNSIRAYKPLPAKGSIELTHQISVQTLN